MLKDFLLSWYFFSKKHFIFVNILLLILFFFSTWCIKNLKFNADWLSLFNQNSSYIVEYKNLIGKEGLSDIFIKLQDTSDMQKSINLITEKKIAEVYPMRSIENKSQLWLKVKIPEVNLSEQNSILNQIVNLLDINKINYSITGPLQIIKEFNKSVENDFINTGIVTIILVGLVILLFYGFSPLILYGFFLQITGLIFSLFIYSCFFGDINIITATMPCILIGLGIDFVIHSVTPYFNSKSDDIGKEILTIVAKPMFLGAVTTSISFFSLCFSDLSGLKSAGFLGGISVMSSYFFVILFIPAFSVKVNSNKSLGIKYLMLPFIKKKNRLIIPIFLIIFVLSAIFIPRIKFEEKIENLYDSKLPSLVLQNNLVEYIGFYPVPLFLKFPSKNPNKDLIKLRTAKLFNINSRKNFSDTEYVIVNIIALKNPFERKNIIDMKNEVSLLVPTIEKAKISFIGSPVLCQKLNNLLLYGIIIASVVVSIVIFLLVCFFFKSIKNALFVLTILFLSSLLTIAFYGIIGINLSIYTIILFPLFLGIGVDDCMHILFNKAKLGKNLDNNSNILKSLSLTTITTILGYGALILADNQGFKSMGIAATIGLFSSFFITIYILPHFISIDEK